MKLHTRHYKLEKEIDEFIEEFSDQPDALDRFEHILTSHLVLNDGEVIVYTDAEIEHSLKYFHCQRNNLEITGEKNARNTATVSRRKTPES